MKSNHFVATTIILSSFLRVHMLFAAEPDLSTPKNAVLSFYKAKDSGDTNTLKQILVSGDATKSNAMLADSSFAFQAQRLHSAIEKKFGKEEADRVMDIEGARDLKPVETGKESIQGDEATVTKNGEKEPAFFLKKVDGKWKIDLSKISEFKIPTRDLEGLLAQRSYLARGLQLTVDDVEKGIVSETGKEMKTHDDLLDDLNFNVKKAGREMDNKKSAEEKKP
ncbi:MAG: hypothetical protein JWQ35_398 [Bacteriovoracaceae bacterium]|nr:hypothetical protein [Bacteriovoracaceae bacterium]